MSIKCGSFLWPLDQWRIRKLSARRTMGVWGRSPQRAALFWKVWGEASPESRIVLVIWESIVPAYSHINAMNMHKSPLACYYRVHHSQPLLVSARGMDTHCQSLFCIFSLKKEREKLRERIAACRQACHHRYGNSHTGSHSVACHPAEVTFPPLPQPKLVLDLVTPEGCKAELT